MHRAPPRSRQKFSRQLWLYDAAGAAVGGGYIQRGCQVKREYYCLVYLDTEGLLERDTFLFTLSTVARDTCADYYSVETRMNKGSILQILKREHEV